MKAITSVLVVLLLGIFSSYGNALSDIISVTGGKVKGSVKDGVLVFRDIPFAAPPVGLNRWAPPKPVIPWNNVLDGAVHRPVCPQFKIGEKDFLGDEDCLFLSVYAPADVKPNEKLDVFFWIYGGGWTFGDNYEFGLYDAKNLVRKHRYIVVAPNYRLGALGFLAHHTGYFNEGTSGNFGILDQRAALQWTQKNIANFGGNPGSVTILGESAGAFSVCFHIASKGSTGLFHRAVMESGTCDSQFFFQPIQDQMKFATQYARDLGCPDANQYDCLRSLPVHVFMGMDEDPTRRGDPYPTLYPSFGFSATIAKADGITRTPFETILRNEHNNVPIITGTNLDEGTLFLKILNQLVPTIQQPYTESDIAKGLTHVFGAVATSKILKEYPKLDYDSADKRLAIILRDYFFVCSNRRLHQVLHKNKSAKSYLYQFTHANEWIDFKILGVYHIFELFFVFDNEFPPILHNFDANDRKVANAFGSYWSNFVKNGDPNVGEPVPKNWPVYSSSSRFYLDINANPKIGSSLEEAKCQFWDMFSFNKTF